MTLKFGDDSLNKANLDAFDNWFESLDHLNESYDERKRGIQGRSPPTATTTNEDDYVTDSSDDESDSKPKRGKGSAGVVRQRSGALERIFNKQQPKSEAAMAAKEMAVAKRNERMARTATIDEQPNQTKKPPMSRGTSDKSHMSMSKSITESGDRAAPPASPLEKSLKKGSRRGLEKHIAASTTSIGSATVNTATSSGSRPIKRSDLYKRTSKSPGPRMGRRFSNESRDTSMANSNHATPRRRSVEENAGRRKDIGGSGHRTQKRRSGGEAPASPGSTSSSRPSRRRSDDRDSNARRRSASASRSKNRSYQGKSDHSRSSSTPRRQNERLSRTDHSRSHSAPRGGRRRNTDMAASEHTGSRRKGGGRTASIAQQETSFTTTPPSPRRRQGDGRSSSGHSTSSSRQHRRSKSGGQSQSQMNLGQPVDHNHFGESQKTSDHHPRMPTRKDSTAAATPRKSTSS